jgi:polysaccharide deacetylase 2 family uncharacterized protein YibQ
MKIKDVILEINPGNMKREVRVVFNDNSEKVFKQYNTKKKNFPYVYFLLNYYNGSLGYLHEETIAYLKNEVTQNEYYF